MNSAELKERMETAIKTNDSFMAYQVFQTYLNPLIEIASRILRDSRDNCQDWVLDQLLELSIKHLRSIRNPSAWKTFLHRSIHHRAISYGRNISPPVPLPDTVPDSIEPAQNSTVAMPNHSSKHNAGGYSLENVSYRDRAILKITYGVEPDLFEWKALAMTSGVSEAILRKSFDRHLDSAQKQSSKNEEKLIELSNKLLKLQSKQTYLDTQLDYLLRCDPTDEDAVREQTEKIEAVRASYVRMYRRYHALQKPQRFRVRAKEISNITGMTVNEIHQAVSRARRKMKGSRR